MENKKIAIIGCGNLGLSILNGILTEKSVSPTNIIVTKRNIHALEHLKESGVQVMSDNIYAVQNAEIIIIALKPYNILEVLKELQAYFNPKKHIIVSLATGISLAQIDRKSVV